MLDLVRLWGYSNSQRKALTGKKVYLQCLENHISTSVVLLYMYAYLPMDVWFLDEILQLCNRSDKNI